MDFGIYLNTFTLDAFSPFLKDILYRDIYNKHVYIYHIYVYNN